MRYLAPGRVLLFVHTTSCELPSSPCPASGRTILTFDISPLLFLPVLSAQYSLFACLYPHGTYQTNIATMLSRRLACAARMVPLRTRHVQRPIVMLPSMMQTVRNYADKVVQVPQMAESISEGTLKQFSKGIGDYVEQDEEIATIETDKVCPDIEPYVQDSETDPFVYRLTSLSMPPKLVLSRNFSSARKIPSPLGRISFAWSSGAHHREGTKKPRTKRSSRSRMQAKRRNTKPNRNRRQRRRPKPSLNPPRNHKAASPSPRRSPR